MELSKEVYAKSPEKKDVQSVVKDLMEDEKIVGKKKTKKKEVSDEKPVEKKKRGRPPKKSEDDSGQKEKEIPKKSRGRPRKIKEVSPEASKQIDIDIDTDTDTDKQIDIDIDKQIDILPLIQSISSTHNLHSIPDKTLKFIIFLIHLSYHTPIPNLTTLIHTTLLHTHTTYTHHAPTIKHLLFSSTQDHITDKKI